MTRALVLILCCHGCAIALGQGPQWGPRRPDPRVEPEPARFEQPRAEEARAIPADVREAPTAYAEAGDDEIRYSVTPLSDRERPRRLADPVQPRRRTESPRLERTPYNRAERLRRLEEYEEDARHAAYQEEILTPEPSGVPPIEDEAYPAPLQLESMPYDPVYESQTFGGDPSEPWGYSGIGEGYPGGYGDHQKACGPPHRFWVRGEWLLWWTKGMDAPPLVTTSPGGAPPATPPEQAGVLGFPNTQILFGDTAILDGWRHGARFRAGAWLDAYRRIGVEGEYFSLLDESLTASWSSDAGGNPILARPFFNMNPRILQDPNDPNSPLIFDPPAREDSQLVSYPGLLAGTVTVDAATSFHSAGLRLRKNLCCSNRCCQDPNSGGSTYCGGTRIDGLLGYRYLRLKDRLSIREDLRTLNLQPNQLFDITDSFRTTNSFHGGEVGVLWEGQYDRWSLEALLKVALGVNNQVVDIDGSTFVTAFAGGPQILHDGGLLAHRTNDGRHERDVFCVVPELGVTLGYQLTRRIKATAGYSFIYWSRVVRPGDQIDLDVNPDLLPPEFVPFAGALRPRFAFNDTDYWLHGLNVGLDVRF